MLRRPPRYRSLSRVIATSGTPRLSPIPSVTVTTPYHNYNSNSNSNHTRNSSSTASSSDEAPSDTALERELDLPLKGIRVLELGQLIAGPFAGQLLGQFGAEIIKIEPPTNNTGDPLRTWRELDIDGTSPWFRSIARNKKSVGVDLRTEAGRGVVRRLMRGVGNVDGNGNGNGVGEGEGEGEGEERVSMRRGCDVVIENFKPGTLEKWGLGPADIHPYNPGLIFTRVSGYGQTGPWAQRPGYASVCEAESGFRYINGYPDERTGELVGAPVRPNISLGDSVAGLHAAFGTVLALLARQRQKPGSIRADTPFAGRIVDVSIVESMLNLMEGIIPEYDRKGKIRGPSGSSVTGIVPTNAYPCRPSSSSSPTPPTSPTYDYVVIGGNGDSIYTRLMHTINRRDLTGPAFAHNTHRVARQAEIEDAISGWTRMRTVGEVVQAMQEGGVPVGRVCDVGDVVGNEQVRARGAVREVRVRNAKCGLELNEAGAERNAENGAENGVEEEKEWTVKMQSTFPVLQGVDGAPKWAGPELGSHTTEVLRDVAGYIEEEIEKLREEGVVL